MDETTRGGAPAAWHSYRCPVCGHTDEARVPGGPASMLSCSHCATPLEITVLAPDEAAAAVKVASRWRGAR